MSIIAAVLVAALLGTVVVSLVATVRAVRLDGLRRVPDDPDLQREHLQ